MPVYGSGVVFASLSAPDSLAKPCQPSGRKST
jgi:hypothetical protein